MDVSEIRGFIRNHMEVDEEELPDVLLNVYLQEAFDRTMAADNRWPRNEKTWSLSKVSGTLGITLPPDLNPPSIMSIVSVDNGYQLPIVNHENAESAFTPLTSAAVAIPVYVSVWDNKLWLWPQQALDTTYDLTVRGYRQPVWTNGASDVPDLDPRLHATLAYFAISLAYAAQEDEILEGVYMARWDRDLKNQMRTIMEPVHNRPLVLHGGAPVGGVPSFVIHPPPQNGGV
jgi:hypothetical protein